MTTAARAPESEAPMVDGQTETTPKGVTFQTYRPAGRPTFRTAG